MLIDLKKAVLYPLVFLCLFGGLKVISDSVLYNMQEMRHTHILVLSCLRELKLPGEIIEYTINPGIRFKDESTAVDIKLKKLNTIKDSEIIENFCNNGWIELLPNNSQQRIYYKNNLEIIYNKLNDRDYSLHIQYKK